MTDSALAAHKRLSAVLPRRIVATQWEVDQGAESPPRGHYVRGRQSILLDELRRRGPCTTTELAEWLGWDARQTSYAMTDLRRDGKVVYMRRGQRHYWSAK